ncbi:MAG: HEPN domain-containing protein [Candidatus Nanohalobium sp.]
MAKQSSNHLEIAEEMLSDARFNLENDRSLRTVEDRAFYAMYHAVLEVLEELDYNPSSRSSTIALFGREVVHERKLVDAEYHSMLSKYQAKRQEADYEKVFLDDREDARQFLEDAEEFVKTIKKLLPIEENR